jgi:hypothetical protein
MLRRHVACRGKRRAASSHRSATPLDGTWAVVSARGKTHGRPLGFPDRGVARRMVLLVACALTSVSFASCSHHDNCDTFEIEGAVRFIDVEGGCWLITATDGESYEPINLPREFREDGLLVEACLKRRRDLGSFCMVGEIVEIISIRRARDDTGAI